MPISQFELPQNLPAPQDDGAAQHLTGMKLPPLNLLLTNGKSLDLAQLSKHLRTVLYIYPMTGRPGVALPDNWDMIPGARGCTPQSCSFRDHHADIQALSAQVFGLSSQSSSYQREAKERLHLPFELISDEQLELHRHLNLPTFSVEGMTLYKRLSIVVKDQHIEKVFYPVFPPDKSAEDVIEYLRGAAA